MTHKLAYVITFLVDVVDWHKKQVNQYSLHWRNIPLIFFNDTVATLNNTFFLYSIHVT